MDDLETIARTMVAPGKGILAVDETVATCTKRFAEFGIESTEDSRRAYRQLFFTAPGVADYVSAAILVDETIGQKTDDGTPFPDLLTSLGIVPGIKVDRGAKPLALAPGEAITEGLDGLRERLAEYHKLGARFAKWRAVITIGPGVPTRSCIEANAHALARYAAMAQEAGLVPIVEPEVLMNGDHDIFRCQAVTQDVLRSVFEQLASQQCPLNGMVLKPNMVVPGTECPVHADTAQMAELTLQTLRRCVPAVVPGVAFLSGGLSGEDACKNLNAMTVAGPHAWELTFSFGRALQFPALQIWRGESANVPAAQTAFLHRARMSSLARMGAYSPGMEDETSERA